MVNGEEPSVPGDVPLRSAIPDQPEQPIQTRQPAQAEKPDRPTRVDRSGQADPADRATPSDQTERPTRAGTQVERPPLTDRPTPPDQISRSIQFDRPTRTDQVAPAQRPVEAGQTDRPVEVGQGDRPVEVGPTDRPATSGPAADPLPRRQWRLLPHRGAHALRRLPPPRQMAAAAARSTAAWSRRPSGRIALPGLLILALVGFTVAAGAYLVPATVPVDSAQAGGPDGNPGAVPGSSSSASPTDLPTSLPSAGLGLPTTDPSATATAGTGLPGVRPADALRDWAQQMATRVGIPEVAMQAYGYAELVLAESTPACRLSWTTLAAIGKVESNHGSSNGATLYPDGRALPAILGPKLDGSGGQGRITDTDTGALDGDRVWDRAVGPMQFIPQTWRAQAVDADNDGIRDPNDIDDATLAAGNYLCANGRNLSTSTGWWQAIASYNRPQSYGDAVFAAANNYGVRSRG